MKFNALKYIKLDAHFYAIKWSSFGHLIKILNALKI